MASLPTVTGEVEFDYPSAGKPIRTWYKIVGDLSISSSKPSIRPCILIHGGPSMAHNYLLPMSALTSTYSIPTIFYDQIGCGNSTHLREKGKEFWSTDFFVDELVNLIAKLGLEEYDILGSSWGGIIASQFAITQQPKGLRRLILSNTFASVPLRNKASTQLRTLLPAELQATLNSHEEAGTTNSAPFLAAYQEYSKRFICNVSPPPPDLQASIDAIKDDPTVLIAMSGTGRLLNTGNNRNWSMVGRAGAITAETLLMNGNHEISSDEALRPFWKEIPRVKWVKLMGSSHSPHFEEPERYLELVGEFLSAA